MILKCKICGGDIEVSEDRTFGNCMYCGNAMTFPRLDDEQRANMFNRGNQYRRMGDFDRAVSVYEQIIRENNEDAEAHWCCALSRFGIEYVEDPATFEWLPTCHRLSFDSFLEDMDYLAALEYSEGIEKKQYIRDASKIVEVQRGILKTSQNEEPFDVFICYKESTDSGERTPDSVLAQEIYYQLTDRGYRVFFSRITMEDKAGMEYEPYIFAALNSAKVMIVVGTRREYMDAVWVKNEWSRYLSIMRKERDRVLLPCYRDMDPYDMPEALSVLQSYDMSKIGFMQDLVHGIGKIIRLEKEESTHGTGEELIYMGNQIEPLMKRITIFLEDGDFDKADEYCERILNTDPENVKAYLFKCMAAEGVRTEQELLQAGGRIRENKDFQKALRFADGEEKAKLEQLLKDAEEYEKESRYTRACELSADEGKIKDICEAYCIFRDLEDFRDAEKKKADLETRVILPQYNVVAEKANKARKYSELKEAEAEITVFSECFPGARKFLEWLQEYRSSWRPALDKILEDPDRYRNTIEICKVIQEECPGLLEDEKHAEFAKKLNNLQLFEKYYGNSKESTLKLLREYCENCTDA